MPQRRAWPSPLSSIWAPNGVGNL